MIAQPAVFTATLPTRVQVAAQELTAVDRELKLRLGTYRLWCSIADHKMLGMRATLRVVARKG